MRKLLLVAVVGCALAGVPAHSAEPGSVQGPQVTGATHSTKPFMGAVKDPTGKVVPTKGTALGETMVRGSVKLEAPDGGDLGSASIPVRVDPTGTTTQPGAEVPFNGSDQCVTTTLPASGLPDGGTYSLNIAADTWHVLEVKGDGSGGWMGCWGYSRLSSPQDCTLFPGLKDGQQTFESFTRVTTADAGVLNGRAVIYAYATIAGTIVKLCPKTPSR